MSILDKNFRPPAPVTKNALRSRTRRDFLMFGAAAAAGVGGYSWLTTRPADDDAPWPFRNQLRLNESITKAIYSPSHLAPEFDPASVTQPPRINGDVALDDDDFDPRQWKLSVTPLGGSSSKLSLANVKSLPKVEHVTQLKCIEGWTIIVHWAGARLSDFTAKYAPGSERAGYVSLVTPDEDPEDQYYVGIDMPSALHPQTLLCYEMNGKPLTLAHGAPLRLVIPVKYGIKNIKRIGSISYTDSRPRDYWAEQGYDWYAGM